MHCIQGIGYIQGTNNDHCLGSTILNKSLVFSDWNAKASVNSQEASASVRRHITTAGLTRPHSGMQCPASSCANSPSASELTTRLFCFCYHLYRICLQIFHDKSLQNCFLMHFLISYHFAIYLSTA